MTGKIPGGYILLARKTLESEIMDKPPLYFKLWGWMLLQAKFRPKNGLKRGQFKTSIKEMQAAMAHHVGYRKETPTVKQIRKAYEGLTKGSMIGTTKGTDGLIVTILNYDKYQNQKNYEGHHEGHHEGEEGGTPYNKEEGEECNNGDILSYITSDICEFSQKFIEYIQTTKANRAPSGDDLFKNSAETVDKLIRLDGFTLDYVRQVLVFAVNDEFWSDNTLSLASLRRKTDGLTKFQKIASSFEKSKKKKLNGHDRSKENARACHDFIYGGDDE
jgi:hypothetical protein